eukprot:scaffold4727_cov36-Prasinocladus_malaysianus.AAC.1
MSDVMLWQRGDKKGYNANDYGSVDKAVAGGHFATMRDTKLCFSSCHLSCRTVKPSLKEMLAALPMTHLSQMIALAGHERQAYYSATRCKAVLARHFNQIDGVPEMERPTV